MHSFYNFDFLGTISRQLQEKLEELPVSILNEEALDALETYQAENTAKQGVYLLHYEDAPVYVGKAGNVAERLRQHLRKLSGRRNIHVARVGYKALVLDKSMSTAANEDVLVTLFKEHHPNMWNGQGFGPKDPGQQRDTTRPSPFDTRYPIREDFPVPHVDDEETVATLLVKMKDALPYVCRFALEDRGDTPILLAGVDRISRSLMQAVVNTLGVGWKAAILSYGMVLYRTEKRYTFGVELTAE